MAPKISQLPPPNPVLARTGELSSDLPKLTIALPCFGPLHSASCSGTGYSASFSAAAARDFTMQRSSRWVPPRSPAADWSCALLAPCPHVPAAAGMEGRGIMSAGGSHAKLSISKGSSGANPSAWGFPSPPHFTACLNPCPSFPARTVFLDWVGFTLPDLQRANELY